MTRSMTPIGTHVGCGGPVVLVAREQSGYRLCTDCGRRAGAVALVEEQPEAPPTEKVTLSRKVRAFQYVSRLRVDYVIGPAEEQAIDGCAIYLQQALAHYGLDIEQTPLGWKVVERVR